jgi:hypothetical protein
VGPREKIRARHLPLAQARRREKWQAQSRTRHRVHIPGSTLTLWDRLSLFVQHGEIEIDNNLIENDIRLTAVWKKNGLFVGGETTGQRVAVIYTLVECAKRQGHKPKAYLTNVLEGLPAMACPV